MENTIWLQSTDSTNRDAFQLAEQGAEHGTSVISHEQRRGRGRLGKVWFSPSGKGLYCSIIIRPALDPQQYPQLTFVAGLAVASAIEQMYGLSAGLKWPNDIYFNEKKCGGILTESSGFWQQESKPFAIVGIGLNVNTEPSEFPAEVIGSATSLYIESGRVGDIETVFSEIRLELLEGVKQFEKDGFSRVLESWRKHDFLLGRKLAWVSVSGGVVEGVSLGPDEEGRLHILDDLGVEHEVLSGDIRLASSR